MSEIIDFIEEFFLNLLFKTLKNNYLRCNFKYEFHDYKN